MKLYVILPCDEYEGYDEPTAVFSSIDAAKLYASELMKKRDRPDIVEVFEMDLNDIGSESVHEELSVRVAARRKEREEYFARAVK
jgi:hypothetical protein